MVLKNLWNFGTSIIYERNGHIATLLPNGI